MKEAIPASSFPGETRLGFFGDPSLTNMGLDHCAPSTPAPAPRCFGVRRLGVAKDRPVLAITRLDGSSVLTVFAHPETDDRRLIPEASYA